MQAFHKVVTFMEGHCNPYFFRVWQREGIKDEEVRGKANGSKGFFSFKKYTTQNTVYGIVSIPSSTSFEMRFIKTAFETL